MGSRSHEMRSICHATRRMSHRLLTMNPETQSSTYTVHPKLWRGWGGKHVENLLPSTMMTKHRFSSSVLSPAG